MAHKKIRILYANEHTTIHAGMGVFLAGPNPTKGDLSHGWRRKVLDELSDDPRICACMTVVAPEPESGPAEMATDGGNGDDMAVYKQTQWEWQYLEMCRITAFWLPTYWNREDSGPFPSNIGPTSRWEFGYFFARWEQAPHLRELIAGAPADADGVRWAQYVVRSRGLAWHELAEKDKDKLVAPSFVAAIKDALLRRKWCRC
jgi:hypothetical protein